MYYKNHVHKTTRRQEGELCVIYSCTCILYLDIICVTKSVIMPAFTGNVGFSHLYELAC